MISTGQVVAFLKRALNVGGRLFGQVARVGGSWSVARCTGILALIAIGASSLGVVMVAGAGPVVAQWWPFEPDRPRPAPRPRQPLYGNDQFGRGTGRGSPICIELEQRLAQEAVRGSQAQTRVPALRQEQRNANAQLRQANRDLERSNCYEYFLFSKTVRRTRRCINLARNRDRARARSQEINAQLQQISSGAGRSYRDDIIRDLAANGCGANYVQEARRRNNFGFWDSGEDDGYSGGLGRFRSQGFSTYRTICVRLCDGYYFPVSFSTLPNHFERDANVCQQKCAAPAELYYHLNPGAGVDQAMSARTNELYTNLKTAFRYRKEFVQGCSCKVAEFVPEPGSEPPLQQGGVPGGTEFANTGAGTRSSGAAQVAPEANELPWGTPQ